MTASGGDGGGGFPSREVVKSRKGGAYSGRQYAVAEKRAALAERRGTVGTRLQGGRRALVATATELVARAADQIREEMTDPEFIREFCETLKYGASRECMDRTCINAVLHITKLLGEERRITVEFVQSLGAGSEEEVRRYVEAAKSVEGAGPHDGADRCVAFLEAYLNVYPEQRQAALRRLGGWAPVPE